MDIRSLLQKLFHWMTIRPTSESTDGNNDFTGGICMNEEKTIRLNFGDKECLIAPYEYPVTPEILRHYKKLELSPSEKNQMSQFVKHISSAMENEESNQSFYAVKWPDGLPNMLTPFTDGSCYMGTLLNESGKIAAQTRLMPLNPYLLIRAGFSLLALISQIFLWSVHQKLNVINQKIDEILEFLYGDKIAELLAAISFTRYAYENFSSIMEHDGRGTRQFKAFKAHG